MRNIAKWLALSIVILSLVCKSYAIYRTMASHSDIVLDPIIAAYDTHLDTLLLVLGRTSKFAIWTLFTTNLIETRGIPFITTVLVVVTAGTCCEKLYKQRAFLRFVGVMTVGVTLIEILFALIAQQTPTLICGSHGLVMGLIVALKQLMPGHIIVLFKNKIRIPVRNLSLAGLALATVLYLLDLEDNLLGYFLGFFIGWAYLRFFNKTEYIGRGDASDEFAFTKFLPQKIGKVLDPPVNFVHQTLVQLGLNKLKFTQAEIEDANKKYTIRLSGTALPVFGEARTTNERRKMMVQTLEHDI